MAFDPSTARLTGFALDGAPATEQPQQKPKQDGVRAADLLKQGVGGAVSASGYLLRGVGDLINSATPSTGDNAISAKDRLIGGGGFIKAGNAVAGAGDRLRDSQSEAARRAVEGSTPEGNIFSPSTWSLGKDPSLAGYALQAANVVGQIAPIAASAVATRGRVLPTAGVSAGLGGGAAAQQEEQRVQEMSSADLLRTPGYQKLIAEGMSPQDARTELATRAGTSAFQATAPVSALSAFTEGLPLAGGAQRALGRVVGQSRAARALSGGLLDAAGEGAQEVAEQAAQIYGANRATGENRALTEDSFSNAVLGGIGGGVIGAAGGVIHGPGRPDQVAGAGTQPDAVPAAAPAPATPADAAAAEAAQTAAAVPASPTDGLTTPMSHPIPEAGQADAAAAPQAPTTESPPAQGEPAPGASEQPRAAQFTPANTAMEHPDGTVEVQPGVSVHPADGPLSAAVATGARAGSFDRGATITASDGSVIDATSGELIRPAPRAVDENGEDLKASKKPEKRVFEPGELDQLVMERLASNPLMSGRDTAMLARTLNVDFADISNAKKRVRRALADERRALEERGITGAAAASAALGASGEPTAATAATTETTNETQVAETQPRQPLNADAVGAAPGDGRNQGADRAEAEGQGTLGLAQAPDSLEQPAGAARGARGIAGTGDRGNAADAQRQAGVGTAEVGGPAGGAQGIADAGRAAAVEGPAAEGVANADQRTQGADAGVANLAKALKRTDRATGPDGATYMVKQNANGEGYHVTRAEDGSTRQHRSPNPAQPWTREQAVKAAADLAAARATLTKENANEATQQAGNAAETVSPDAGRSADSGVAQEPAAAARTGAAAAAAPEAAAHPSAGKAAYGTGAADGTALSDEAAWDALTPSARRTALETAKARKGLSPRVLFKNLNEREKAAVGKAARDLIEKENAPAAKTAESNGGVTARVVVNRVGVDGKTDAERGGKLKVRATSDGFEATIEGPNSTTIGQGRTKEAAAADAQRQQTTPGTPSTTGQAAATGAAQAAPAPGKPNVSANTLFTEDAAERARKLIRSKLTTAGAGIDPELLAAGITLAGYHIERGARTFAAYAKAMVADLGDYVKPHLASWYEATRRYPGMEEHAKEMTPTVEVDASAAAGIPELNATEEAAPASAETTNAEGSVQQGLDENGGAAALETAPAAPVQPAQEQREAGDGARRGGNEDAQRDGGARAESGDEAGRGVAGSPRRVDRARPRDVRTVEQTVHDQIANREVSVQQPEAQRPRNFVITPDFPLGEGGAKSKAAANLEAVRTLKKIEAENRAATPEEQAVLARYVGWGGIPQAFAHPTRGVTKGWERVSAAVEKALTADEHAAARRSTQDAHYTSRTVVGGIYDALAHLGYTGGVTLEPSVGTGNFIGLAPENVRGAQRWKAVELDSITGRIAQQLYPEAGIIAGRGFQEVNLPENYFDAVVGNPPFGSQKLYDAQHKDLGGFSIHNFFFAKSLKSLKPGGVLSMVVSSSMLDKAGGKQRTWLSNHARLLGAIRLPNDAFKANAGTEVTTDIVFLQKLYPGEQATDTSWTEVGAVSDPAGGEPIPLNKYFVQHPEMMLGTMTREGKMRRAGEPTLSPNGRNLAEQLREATARLPQNVMQEPVAVEPTDSRPTAGTGTSVQPYGFYEAENGQIRQRLPDVLDEFRDREVELGARDADRVRQMIGLRDQLKALMRAEMADAPRGQIEGMRTALNTVYDAFQKKFGYVNNPYNANLMREDPDAYRLRAIERDYQRLDKIDADQRGIPIPKGRSTVEIANKAAILERRVFHKEPTPKAETAADAVSVSLNTYGRLNLPKMAELLGKSEEQVVAELGDKVFLDPKDGHVTADEYLSGNVKAKLAQARRAAESDPAFARNVRALEAVQPADVSPADIFVSLGSPWVTGDDYAQFAREVIGIGDMRAKLSPILQKFELSGVANGHERFGTATASARKVFERAINRSDATVYKTQPDGSRTVDGEQTEAMRAAMDAMREEFGEWVWKDQARRDRLARIYNDTYNTDRARQYDGSFMTLPGKVDDSIIALRPSQMNAAWRMIQDGKMLADHVVGAGKTYTAIAAGMQMKRMGLAKKPMYAVPNHLVGQWAGDWMKLYPNANILAVTEQDFAKDRRKLTFSRIATGDWDAVIVAHSQFTRIAPPRDFEERYLNEKIAEYETAIAEAKAGGGDRRSIKQIEKQREQIEEKLKSNLDRISRDRDTVAFDEMGIDHLFVDEAHEFKNLGFSTSKRNVSGMGSAANGGSQKAEDLFIKTRYLNSVNKGRGLFFLTGTPVSNSLAEMFTMQRYMAYDDMKARGIHLFDLWANTFAQESTSFELDSSGRGLKPKTVLSKFLNVPEMMQLYKRFADTVTLNDLKEMTRAAGGEWPVPKIKGGKPQNIVVEGGAPLMAYIDGNIIPRMEAVSGERGAKPDPSVDNMLKITNDARLAALDVRLKDPYAPDDPNSKPNTAVRKILATYRKWDAQKGTQLVFCDLSTPKAAIARERAELAELQRRAGDGDEAAQAKIDAMSPDEVAAISSQFSVYDDVREKLIAGGIPAREVAFIHDANTDLQKKSLFDRMNRGDVRVLLGSTSKMGAGTNVQARLVALTHLDAPWRPSDLEQREGRIVRQGNLLYAADPDGFEVEINRYATERTYDARMWQLIERKAGIVEQVRKGDPNLREVDDVAGEAANAAEMKAAATGNPLIIEQVELQAKAQRLTALKRAYDSRRYDAESEVARTTGDGGPEAARAAALERADAGEKLLADNPRDPFAVTVDGKPYTEFKKGADALAVKVVDGLGDIERSGGKKEIPIGQFRGADLTLRRVFGGDETISVTYPDPTGKIGEIRGVMNADGAVSGSGLLTKINNAINSMGEWREDAEVRFKRQQRRLGELQDLLAQPFKQADELAKAQARLKEVTAQLVSDSKKSAVQKQAPSVKSATDDDAASFDLTEDQTQTPAFKRWFGDSKVVDANGRPIVVYHGTTTDVSAFSEDFFGEGNGNLDWGDGFYFTDAPEAANTYAVGEGANVVPVYLAIKNPAPQSVVLSSEVQDAADGHFNTLRDVLEQKGYDGIVIEHKGGEREIVAFRPEQIKSAVGNVGAFDPSSPDISLDMAGYKPTDLSTAGARAIYAAIERIAAPLRSAGVDVRVVDDWRGFPDVVKQRGISRAAAARGVFLRSKDGKTARVFINAAQVGTITQAKRTLMHEVVGHWGMERLLGDQFDAVAKDALRLVRSDPRLSAIRERVLRYKDKGERTMAKEALAMLAEADIKTGVMARVYAAIRRFLRAIGLGDVHLSHDEIRLLAQQAARGLVSGVVQRSGIQSADSLARNLRNNAFAFDFDLGPGEGADDLPPHAINDAIHAAARWRVTDIAQSAIDKISDWKGELLGSLTLHQLAEVSKPYLPQVGRYDEIVRQMGARRNELMGQSDPLAKKWANWQRKNKAESAALAEAMHDATLAGVDPDQPFQPGVVHLASGEAVPMTQEAVNRIIPELERRADAAPAGPAAMIRLDIQRLRDTLAQESARVAAYPKLQAQFNALPEEAKALYREVRDMYAARGEAMQRALEKRIKGLNVSEEERKALTDRTRAHFESAKVQAPYFPLARFGNYWVSAKKDGETVFKMVETAAQQRRVEAAFKAQGYATTAGMKIDMARAIDGASGSFVANVVDTLSKAGVEKNVADEIYQLYLRTLPDLSLRKNFIHRKGTPGYDADALRAFAGQMFHGAHQLARLEYSQDAEQAMGQIVNGARELGQGDDTETANAAARVANEMQKRHEWVMSPKDAGWVQKLSSANFAFYLGASPAAALVNLTQTYVMSYPALAARHGWVKAFAEINRAMGQTISTYGNVDKKLAGDELRAMQELDRLGARDKTLTHDLAGLAEGSTQNYNPGWRKTMEVISHLFHKAEVFNREATGLAAYRMARSAGESHEAAIRYAADTIFQTHGDYQNANRARWMQSNAAKVIFAFKQYSQMMTYNLWRNFYQATKGLTKEERSEARKKLTGTLGVTALLSGAMGMPLLSVAFALANAAHALWGDDDEPWDAETEFHNFLVEHLGQGFGRAAAYGPTQALTGVGIADRTKLNDLWFRAPDQELEGRALADYWLEQIGGPIAGTWLINPLTAAKLWNAGNTERAAEQIMPKALKDALKTLRFATQGVNNLDGQPIVKDLTPYEYALQAAGFSPARVAEQYKINNALKGYEKQIETRRQALLNGYTMAMSLNDPEAVRAAAQKITAFNAANPTFPINGGQLRRSLIQKRRMADSMVNGILLNKKLDAAVRARVAFEADDGEASLEE
jgi:N12 class adenine-specific DNA methylase